MKIKAFVTIVAPAPNGESVKIEPDQVGEVRDAEARKMISEGYAEKASKKDEITSTDARNFGGARNTKRSKPVQTTTESDDDKKKSKKRRTRDELLGGGTGANPDKEKGDNGKGFDEGSNDADEDNSNAE